MKKILYYTAFAIMCLAAKQTLAVPAYPGVITYQLPDGSTINVYLRGDENVNWMVSLDGFTILANHEGFLEYATLDESGDLKLSGVRAHNPSERAQEEWLFLSQHQPGLRFSQPQVDILSDFRKTIEELVPKSGDGQQRVPSGVVRVPVILVAFQDRAFTRTKAEFEMLLDQLNYTAGGMTGSLRDYFLDNSYGKMDLRVDVFGPYTLPGPIIEYTDNRTTSASDSPRCGGDPRNMARQAIDSAHFSGQANWALYDAEGDGRVNTVHIIYAGYGTEAGAPRCGSIWAHAWSFSPARSYSGRLIGRYSSSPELRSNSGNTITNIGVIAHELGHSLLGLRDFYDTDRDGCGGRAVDLGEWCVMASGSWNNQGRTPANFSAYARVNSGWVQEVTLSTPANITLPNPLNTGIVYRVNTATPNEYFLIENRRRVGWDAHIPSSGMLIYRVDRNHPGWSSSGSNANRVNCTPNNRGYYLMQAGCNAVNGCSSGRQTDPWPQTGRTSFTDETTPSSRSKAGVNTDKPITHIVQNLTEGTISFRFMGGELAPTITTTSLPGGRVDVEYNQTLTATGEEPMTWTLEKGDLPEGLTLSEAGVISGIPETVETAEFEVRATNDYGSMAKEFSIAITPAPLAPTITTTSLAGGFVGIPYDDTLTATGDSLITWSIVSGNLPRGLSLSNLGVISGTPSRVEQTTLTVRAINEVGNVTEQFTISITEQTTNIQQGIEDETRSLRVWTANNSLHIAGLSIGQTYRIYNTLGILLHQGVATADIVTIDTNTLRTTFQHSTYIIQSEQQSVRVVW